MYRRKKRVYVARNGVSIDEFLNTQEDKEIKRYKPCAVFHGLYTYKPNNVAIKFIIEKIAPKLPELHFIIFGKGSEIIKKEYKNLPKNVVVLGTVSKNRIAKILKACDIAVVPIFWGSGTNLKMIEYLAAGLTIVATPMAARGLGLIPNKHFYLARKEEEFVNKIRFALENKLDKKELIKKATEFDWEKVLKKLVLIFRR
ncbi:MAG TPA: glycosyltransferase [Candidatus Nanopusillus sp.]|nr:glycosyltransferase [Candidatus Nanopusillus sp.]